MAGVLEQLLILCNQLVVIGYDNPEVLIAGMMIVFAISIMIVAIVLGIVISVPILIITGIVKLCIYLYRRKHPVLFEEESDSDVNYMPHPKEKKDAQKHRTPSAPVSDLPPVYPDWMNQKSGRLL